MGSSIKSNQSMIHENPNIRNIEKGQLGNSLVLVSSTGNQIQGQ